MSPVKRDEPQVHTHVVPVPLASQDAAPPCLCAMTARLAHWPSRDLLNRRGGPGGSDPATRAANGGESGRWAGTAPGSAGTTAGSFDGANRPGSRARKAFRTCPGSGRCRLGSRARPTASRSFPSPTRPRIGSGSMFRPDRADRCLGHALSRIVTDATLKLYPGRP